MKAEVSRIVAAASAVAALGLATACGGGGGSDGSGGDGGGERAKRASRATSAATADAQEPAAGGALTKDLLEKAALADGDVDGFTVRKMAASDIVEDSVPAKPAACQPVADMAVFTSDPAAQASVGRNLTAEGERDASLALSLVLLSYEEGGAEEVLAGLRTAIGKCTEYEHVGYRHTGVGRRTAPGLGDEAVAYGFTASIEGAKVPTTFTVVRSGTTIASFMAMDMLNGDTLKVPSEVVETQLEKLEKLEKTGKPTG